MRGGTERTPNVSEKSEEKERGDELELYLALPVSASETSLLLSNPSDLLLWWKNNERRFPKLAKMAKQYLAARPRPPRPQVWSASFLRRDACTPTCASKSMKDSYHPIEHSLFASFNALRDP